MTYQRFSNGNSHISSTSHFYTETEAVEPTEEDIEEFARRIGIDPKTEPHLVHLAREGLMVNLPSEWKPCKDSHRDAWYYYNNQTHMSQWEHPMDSIYRDKVIQARSDHAMNRIQHFDLNTPKPLKTLPPLKKGGGGIHSFPSTLAKLGPLKNSSFSSSEDLSQFSTNSLQRTSLQPLEPLIKKSSTGLSPLNIPSTPATKHNDSGSHFSEQESFGSRPRIRLDPPISSSAAPISTVKKSGLTLTGAGASFLKAKSSNSNTDLGKIESKEELGLGIIATAQLGHINQNIGKESSNLTAFSDRPTTATTKCDLSKQQASLDENTNFFQPQNDGSNHDGSLSDTSTGKPLKSILVNSSLKTRSRLDEKSSSTTSTKRNLWDISPNEMTEEEHNQWEALDFASKRGKPSVKFHLEDPPLIFERDSDDQDETEESTEEEESEEVLDEESQSHEDKRDNVKTTDMMNKSLQKPLSSGDGKFVVLNENHESRNLDKSLNSTNQRNQMYGEGRLHFSSQESSLNNSDKNDQVLDRKTIKLNMEAQLKEYKTKLEEEEKQQREQIKSNMEKTIAQLKSEMESIISRTKGEFEIKKKSEVDKARFDMETTMMADLEKISNEYKDKLAAKKKELSTVHDAVVKSLNIENQEKLNNVRNTVQFAEAGKEFEKQLADEINKLKDTMTAQHQKQVEEMNSLHKTTIQKLKLEFQAEEEKLKKEHADFIVEMMTKFDTEKQTLVRSFEAEQDKIRQEFAGKAAKLTEELNENLNTMKKQFEEKSKTGWPVPTSSQNSLVSHGDSSTGGMKTAELKQAEHELSNLRLKYKSLEDKYNNLKKGVHNVVVNEKAKLDHKNNFTSFQLEDINEGELMMNRENLEDLYNTNNTVDSGAAESADTSLSLSSIENQKNSENDDENGKTITKMMTGSNDRLNQVLTALEDLKKQMLDIKSEQRKIGSVDLSREEMIQEENHFDKDDMEILHHRHGSSKKKKSIGSPSLVTKDSIVPHVSEVRVPRARVSRSALDSPVTHRISSKSTNEIGDKNNGRNYMDDFMKAKDFIKSEKYRLKRPGLSFGTPVSTTVGARQRQDYKINQTNNMSHGEYYNNEAQTLSSHLRTDKNNKNTNVDHHSETESSGVGSWKEGKMEEKSKIGQDIEGILTSLQQLDRQMKYLWSVVGEANGGRSPNASTMSPLITSSLQTPQPQIPMTIPVGHAAHQHHVMSKNLGSSPLSSYPRDSINISELAMKYNLSPNLITPGNQALINSINVVNSPQFRRSLDVTTTTNPVLTTLEEHVNNIRNRQSRILSQYPTTDSTNKRDKSPSISEKTRDLREWLEKF